MSIKAVSGSIEQGTPKEAIRAVALRYSHPGADYHTYAVSADGLRILSYQRVLTTTSATTQTVPEIPIPGLILAINWTDKIKK